MEPASIRSECRPAARAIPRRALLAGGVATVLLKTLPAVAQTTAAALVLDDARTYRVAAGARWRQVVTALDPLGWSPAVMRSNNDFGLAATLSVNAHGWPVPYGPFGTTVRSFRLMLASGDLVTCSPMENSELFAARAGICSTSRCGTLRRTGRGRQLLLALQAARAP